MRDALTLVVDRSSLIERMLARNPGGKTSALETAPGSAGKAAADRPEPGTDVRQSPEQTIDLEIERVRPYDIGI